MQRIESECVWYTGFLDGFICFEILEYLNEPDGEINQYVLLNHLYLFKKLFDVHIQGDALIGLGLKWIIDKIVINKVDDSWNKKELIIDSHLDCERDSELIDEFREEYLSRQTGVIYAKPEKITEHLNKCMKAWREDSYFNHIWSSINQYVSKKQEEIILRKFQTLKDEWLNMKNYVLKIRSLFDNDELIDWLDLLTWEEPNVPINPFMCLWSLQDRGKIQIIFGWISLFVWEEPIYRIKMLDGIKNQIDIFLDKISHLHYLANEWVLETRKEQDLITEIRNFPYESIIDNEILLLKIKKIKSHPQTIWSSHSSRGYSKSVNQYILDWEWLFQEYRWKNDAPSISNRLQNKQYDWWAIEDESFNKLTINLKPSSEDIINITPYISYDKESQEFLNPKNWKRYALKEEYSKQIIELLLIKQKQEVLNFVNDNSIIKKEYNRWKRGWWKWGAMHTFLQSKIKNITEKIEYHLEIDKSFRSNFLTCDKQNIAIKVSLK